MTDTDEVTTIATTSATKRKRKMAREPRTDGNERPAPDNIPAKRQSKADLVLGLLKRPGPAPDNIPAKRQSKADLVLGLLKRPEGATIDQLVAATSWLPHTTRAALTGLKKKGHTLASEKLEGQGRVYRATAA